MTMLFTLAGFAGHLGKLVLAVEAEKLHALETAAKIIEKEAKSEIGTYQGAAGPFAAWPELKPATKADRVAKGFSEDDPLLRTGEMRDSIEHTVTHDEAHVGSNDDKALWQELGTGGGGWGGPIPARSFLGGAAFRKKDEVGHKIGQHIVAVLVGGGGETEIP